MLSTDAVKLGLFCPGCLHGESQRSVSMAAHGSLTGRLVIIIKMIVVAVI